MRKDPAVMFLEDNFEPEDRLAVVLIDRGSGAVTQRIASMRRIASNEFQHWLRERNRAGADVFVSMNALSPDAHGRTRGDVSKIRHLYLDLDDNGDKALERLRGDKDLPEPNYVVSTSPGRWQVSWKVQGFDKELAEETMRGLVRAFGADPAATDCARVMRVPGFSNHKRNPAHLVRSERLSDTISIPEMFPRLDPDDRHMMTQKFSQKGTVSQRTPGRVSQSELDWAFARRALARGDSPESVIAAIADYRRGNKPNPEYYARLTVEKARRGLPGPRGCQDDPGPDR
jgi:hypothetical protein